VKATVNLAWDFLSGKIGGSSNLMDALRAALLVVAGVLGVVVANLLITAGTAIVAFIAALPALIAGFVAWAVAAGSAAVATIAATWPIIAIAAAIALLAFGIVQLIQHHKQVGQFFSDMGASVHKFLDTSGPAIGSFFSGMGTAVSRFLATAGKDIGDWFSGLGKSTHDLASGVGSDVGKFFSSLGTSLHDGIVAIEKTVGDFATGLEKSIGDMFSAVGSWIKTQVIFAELLGAWFNKDAIQPFIKFIESTAQTWVTNIGNALGSLFGPIGTLIQTSIDGWGRIFSGLGAATTAALDTAWAIIGPRWTQLTTDVGNLFSTIGTLVHTWITAWGVKLSELGTVAHDTVEAAYQVLLKRWNQLSTDIGNLFTAFGTLIQTDIKAWGVIFSTLGSTAYDTIEAAYQVLLTRWNQLSKDVGALFDTIGKFVQGKITDLGTVFSSIGSTVKSALDGAWTTVSQRFTQMQTDSGTSLASMLKAITDAIGGFTKAIEDAFKNALDAVVTFFQQHDPFKGLFDFIGGKLSALGGMIGQVGQLHQQAQNAADGKPVQTGQQLWMSQSGQGASAWSNLDSGTQQLFNRQAAANGGAGGGSSQSADSLISAADAITEGYAGLCEVMAETAIADATGTPYKAMGGTAREAYSNRIAAGQLHGTGTPPPGSLVYFDWTDPKNGVDEGHVGIMRGDGTFRSALDNGVMNLSIASYLQANAAQGANYLGWVVPGFAQGTSNAPGGYAVVGENGPELLNVPRGSQISPNSRIASMLSSGLNDTANIVGSIAQALSAGLADISATVRQASAQPVQINRVVNTYIDTQVLSSEAEGAIWAEQARWMGGN
jgi:hypothetical protein